LPVTCTPSTECPPQYCNCTTCEDCNEFRQTTPNPTTASHCVRMFPLELISLKECENRQSTCPHSVPLLVIWFHYVCVPANLMVCFSKPQPHETLEELPGLRSDKECCSCAANNVATSLTSREHLTGVPVSVHVAPFCM